MTEELALHYFSPEKLAEMAFWAAELNCYRWPENFPILQPCGWDEMSNDEKSRDVTFQIACHGLREIVPERERSKQWWKQQGIEDESAWQRWWDSGQKSEFLPKLFFGFLALVIAGLSTSEL